jgi:hypothetical protein
VSLLSRYRLKNEIDAFSVQGSPDVKIPRGAVIEYAPAANRQQDNKHMEIYWEGRLYLVLIADLFQHAEFIGSK